MAVGRDDVVGGHARRGLAGRRAGLPLTTEAGTPFEDRALIVFLAFTVIFTTLVLQGLSLPLVIRALGLQDDGAELAEQEAVARVRAAEAALARLEALSGESWVRESTVDRMRGTYEFRRRRFAERLDGGDGSIEDRSIAYQRLRAELLAAERAALLDLRRGGAINDEVWRNVERDLDLEHSRLDAPVIER